MSKKSVSVLQITPTIMEKIVKSVICPPTGISPHSSAKSVLLRATTISSLRSVLLVQITLLSGMAPFAPNVPFKAQSGMENTAITVLQDNIGT